MLKIGIIGCGKITQVRHAPEYAQNPMCQLTGFYDMLPEQARALAAEYGGTAYTALDDLLNSGVDAVSVCVANVDHAKAAIMAMEKGIHVLCEKPMGTTPEECEAMVSAAKQSGKFLMLAHNQRFAGAHVAAKKLIAEGALGRVLAFRTTFGHPGPEGWTGQPTSWFYNKHRAAFGALADLGIHKTDLIHFLLGEPITKVSALFTTLDKKYPDGTPINVDDNAYCLYETQSGITGSMHVSWTFYGREDNATRLYGTQGVLRLYDDPEYAMIFEKRDGSVDSFRLGMMPSNVEQTSGGRTNTGVIDAFVECIITGKKPAVDGAESLRVMRVIFAAEQSAREGRVIIVPQG